MVERKNEVGREYEFGITTGIMMLYSYVILGPRDRHRQCRV